MDGGDLHDDGDHSDCQSPGSDSGPNLWSVALSIESHANTSSSGAEATSSVTCGEEQAQLGQSTQGERSPQQRSQFKASPNATDGSDDDTTSIKLNVTMKDSDKQYGKTMFVEDSTSVMHSYRQSSSIDSTADIFDQCDGDGNEDSLSEFLDLPKKLSGRSSPSLLHRLHHGSCGGQSSTTNPDSSILNSYKTQSERQRDWYCSSSSILQDPCSNHTTETEQDGHRLDLDLMVTSNVDIVIENTVEDDDDQAEEDRLCMGQKDRQADSVSAMSHLPLDNPNFSRSSTTWNSLEPAMHTLLSPRSSNGSISSFRSSNADSAIDMLTPEEIQDGGIPDINLQLDINMWENRADFQDQPDIWDNKQEGDSSQGTKVYDDVDQEGITNNNLSWNNPLFRRRARMSDSSSQEQNQGKTNFSLEVFDFLSLGPQQFHTSASKTPAVIISDHSTDMDDDEKVVGKQDKGSQTGDITMVTDSSETDNTEMNYLSFQKVGRSDSNSSICSMESSLSLQSDSSLDVDDFVVESVVSSSQVKKQSSWKKIRNIVHWSPFIQQFKRRKYPWIQLAGHQGNFQAGEPGAILKKFDAREHLSFSELMKDVLRPYVPEYRGDCTKDSDRYLQLQDLLCEFEAPCVMDIKMGCRTYLEEELVKAREKPALRKDMYKKMVEVDSTAPTDEENAQKAITKPRYMQWRDEMSSSVELGFRIEGIRKNEGASLKNFKTTKNKSSVQEILHQFVGDNDAMLQTYLRRLKAIRVTQEESQFFSTHEIIGSSLLFVHDKTGRASIWMIDFGKTVPLSDNVKIDHRQEWVEGNNEDGYLTGMDSLIEIFEAMLSSSTNSNSTQNDTSCSTSDSVNTPVTNTSDSVNTPVTNTSDSVNTPVTNTSDSVNTPVTNTSDSVNTPVTNTSNKDTCNTSVL